MQLSGNTVETGARATMRHASPAHLASSPLLGRHLGADSREARAAWSDDELLHRLFNHEKGAWEEFVRRFHLIIVSCIDRVTRPFFGTVSAADREDIYAQFLYALHARDMHRLRAYRSDRGFRLSTWIGVLTRNVARDYLRRIPRRHQMDALTAHIEGSLGYAEDPERAFERKEGALHTVAVLEMLSPRDRTFVQLFYIERLSPETIASRMGISVKTVYSKKHKLQNKLQQLAFQDLRVGSTPLQRGRG